MANQYFIKIADHVTGPYTSSQVKHMAGEGQIPASARVSVDQKKWYCVENVRGLSVPPDKGTAGLDTEAIEEESFGMQSADLNWSAKTRCDILISYRRKGGSEIARFVAEGLQQRGYSVFLDVDDLGSGNWSDELEHRIAECKDFIPIVTEGFFERCKNTDDIVRKELAHAIANKKHIIPLIATEHPFPTSLPSDIAEISSYNGPRYVHEYAPRAVEKLCAMLKSRVGGPERLHAGEAQPRVVVAMVAMIFGAWQGSAMGLLAGDVGPLQNVGLSDAIKKRCALGACDNNRIRDTVNGCSFVLRHEVENTSGSSIHGPMDSILAAVHTFGIRCFVGGHEHRFFNTGDTKLFLGRYLWATYRGRPGCPRGENESLEPCQQNDLAGTILTGSFL